MQSNFSEFLNVTGAAKRVIQNVTSSNLLTYRGVTYVKQPQAKTKAVADAQILPTNTTLHYRGAAYRLETPADSSAASAKQTFSSWLTYRGAAYQVHRIA
jgi:Domain of unknown function (DUF4278)